jgi:hypothetical protein
MPHQAHLRTGLKAVKPPFERDPAAALALLESVPIAYLIVDGRSGSFTRVFGRPAIELAQDRWEQVFVDVDGEVETFRRRWKEADLVGGAPYVGREAASELMSVRPCAGVGIGSSETGLPSHYDPERKVSP